MTRRLRSWQTRGRTLFALTESVFVFAYFLEEPGLLTTAVHDMVESTTLAVRTNMDRHEVLSWQYR